MNCHEVQELVEEAMDNRLSGSCKRTVARHLARCARCQAFFAAEKSEHAALFRALNDVSDIPPPRLPQSAFAARLVASVPSLAKQAGHVAVPLWFKRAAVLAVLCGGAALAAWFGSAWSEDGDSSSIGRPTSARTLQTPSSEPPPEGTEEMKQKKIAMAASAAILLVATPTQGASSAEATFDSFSSACRTSAEAGAVSFLSRSHTQEDANALPSFNSFEPKGLYILLH